MLVLVTGARGSLGGEIVKALSEMYVPHLAFSRDSLDIENELAIHNILKQIPQITHVINCAAYTNVGEAEKNPDMAFRVNHQAVEKLAKACDFRNNRLIHFSTDYVFSGAKDGFYSEEDKPNPINMYGKSKLSGELAIQNNCSFHKIFRLQWLYGNRGENFLKKITKLYKEKKRLKVVDDQFGSPCSVKFVADVIVKIVLPNFDKTPSGVFHLSHDNFCSWHDFAVNFFKMFDKQKSVRPTHTDKLPLDVARPSNSVLNVSKIKSTFGISSLSTWEKDFDYFCSLYPNFWNK